MQEVVEPSDIPAEPWDAVRRTRLAAERTELAWWRTALTSIAVAVGVGRVVPELSGTTTEWPYVVVGIGWALYSVALFQLRLDQVPTGRARRRRRGDDPQLPRGGAHADGLRDRPLSRDGGTDRRLGLSRIRPAFSR
jgi:uncharacterized membrane protein YidH (DUF202 family)